MKILLAEDDALTRSAMEKILCAEGYDVVAAVDGLDAMQCFQRDSPDLVLLDIMMPGLDGYAVCRRMRAIRPQIPVMFVSAKSEEMDVAHGLQIGGDDFLRKPFGKSELLARVHALIRRSGLPGNPSTFSFGPWLIEPGSLCAKRAIDNVICELTWRELSMLRLLHQHVGNVVTKEEFIHHCWGFEYFPESRTLDQHVLNLRKKLELDPAEPRLIRTIRGVGYVYDV